MHPKLPLEAYMGQQRGKYWNTSHIGAKGIYGAEKGVKIETHLKFLLEAYIGQQRGKNLRAPKMLPEAYMGQERGKIWNASDIVYGK